MPAPDPWLTAAEVRERRPKRLKATDDPEIVRLIAKFEDTAERYIGCARRVRPFTWTGTARDGILDLPYVEIVTCSIEGTAVTADRLDARNGRVDGVVSRRVNVTGTHGLTEPEETLLAACALYVERMIAIDNSGQSRDTLSKVFEGGISERYSTPNWAEGRPTGFLQVDADLNSVPNRRPTVF